MKKTAVVIVDRPRPGLGEYLLVWPIVRGMGVTLRHFLRNLFGQRDVATIQYPEERREYSERTRGRHILTTRDDGSLRCVACYMCETACPADCITIVAGEDPEATVEWEKLPLSFEIDLLRCVFCGYCVDACPKQALIMSRKHEMTFVTREEAVVGIDQLKQKGPIEDEDLGYRPYY
jgi:NADH-quinone oxidoreductase subunit I